MRFDAGLGDFTLVVREESIQLLRGMGTICLQIGLDVKAPPAKEAGRFLALQADLFGIHGSYQRTLVGRVTEMLPFTPETGIERPVLKFLITASQLHAINEARDGDLRMEQLVNWREDWARPYLGQIRYARVHHPENEALRRLERDILAGSPDAQGMWDRREVYEHVDGSLRRLRLPFHRGRETSVRITALRPMRSDRLRVIVLMEGG
ncbi:MmyB family transcriptional regulator [Streptomyces tauricus]|uniref:MmyB family transcriptional regulator n=1 Tax=Streptomyces tauricus TaxID=68274 RepID=UPI003416A1C4